MANNTLRMSGLNSGLDTEAIVNALTAATKNKINKNQRSILKLQAQQDAYRTIIDKFNAFKNKYFDILNVNTCLKSKTMFNSFKSKLTSSTGTDYVPGVTVSSSTNANEATYNVKVNKVATQATYKSSNATGKAVDLSDCMADPTEEYTMKVSVGSKSAYVTFHGSTNKEDMIKDINDQLREAFGVSNKGENLVSLDDEGKFVSSDKSSVLFTKPALYKNQQSTNISGAESGTNSFTITVNGVTKTVSFSTLSKDHFDAIFNDDGTLMTEDQIKNEVTDKGKQSELLEKLALYKQVVLNQRDGEVWDSYESWWQGLSEEEKADFAKTIAESEYNENKKDIEDSYNNTLEARAKTTAYGAYLEEYKEAHDGSDDDALSFNDWLESKGEGYDFAQEKADFLETEAGKTLKENYEKNLTELDELYTKYADEVKNKELDDAYDKYFEEAKQAAYDAAVSSGEISNNEGDANYKSYDDFALTAEDFEASAAYSKYQDEVAAIETKYTEDTKTVDVDRLTDSQREYFYDKYVYSKVDGQTAEDYINKYKGEEGLTAAQEAVYQFNKANIQNNLGALKFNTLGGATINAEYDRKGNLTLTASSPFDGAGDFETKFAITANVNSKNDFGFATTDVSGTASQVSTSSKLSELGLEPDENGNYNFSINGVSFSFGGDTTISEMMKKVNASEAGVKMSYTTLTNQFIITANEYGTGVDIDFEDGDQGLLSALGFGKNRAEGIGTFTEGTNTNLEINGVEVETSSNSYTVDGTTFTFTQAAEGQEFTNEVGRDYSKAIDTIKQFVEDYNKLIDDIYGYVDEEPNGDYYFLTDDDIDEMGLSESQQNKWEKMAQKGLLYRDSTLTDIMSKLRTALYSSVDAADGTKVGLYTLGITTSSDYSNHGKLVFDDTKDFEALFEKYADEITELFSNTENGIAYKIDTIIDNATRTTGGPGERGSLVDKAGVAGTSSATSNALYNKIKSLQDVIASLQRRYEQQQDRYWKIYGNMETMLGNLNSQTSYINQLLGNY